MNHRERVLNAINFKEPDRIPLDLGSVGSLITDKLYFKIKRILGIQGDIKPYRSGSTANYYDERILDALDIDFRHLWLTSPDKPRFTVNNDGTVQDDWGITWSKEGSFPIIFPLKNSDLNEIKNYNWLVIKNKWDLKNLTTRAIELRKADFAVVAKAVLGGGGILERCYYLRSIDQFFIDLVIDPALAQYLIDKIVEIEISLWDMYLDAVGPYVDIIQRGSDFGTQTSLFISPELFRKFIKPAEFKVISFIKKKTPKAKIWFHSCGAIYDLIEDLIDIGINILNPVQPLANGMDSLKLKNKFGKQICFHGGIDIQKALIGSLDNVKTEVEIRIKAFAPGGGYILAPANHIQGDTSAENVIFMYNYAKEFGTYPIGVDK